MDIGVDGCKRGPSIEPWGTPRVRGAMEEELRSMWINLLSVCEARLKPGRSGAGEVFLVTLVLNWQKELHFFGMSVSSSYVLMLKEIVLKNHNI